MKKFSLLIVLLLLTVACTEVQKPREVVVDRDVCARCGMQINDARFPAQAVSNASGSTEKYVFEEIGCAMMWLESAEGGNYTLYVTDLKRPGTWLRADKAVFAAEYITPMGYGVAAMASEADLEEGRQLLSYAEAKERILAIDQARQNKHMGNM